MTQELHTVSSLKHTDDSLLRHPEKQQLLGKSKYLIEINTKNQYSTKQLLLLQKFLDLGSDLNSRDISGATPIFDVCRRNNVDLAQILYKCGSDITSINCLGQSVLHVAAQDKSLLEFLKWTIAHKTEKCNINARDHFRHTALHYACMHDNNPAILILAENGADLFVEDRNNLTPLIFSAKQPDSFRTFVDIAIQHRETLQMIPTKSDLYKLLRFAHYHHTLDEVQEVLTASNVGLPCKLTDFNFSYLPQDVPECLEEYTDLSDWLLRHFYNYPDRVGFFKMLFLSYGTKIVSRQLKERVKHFIDDVASTIRHRHPALAFMCRQSGSVGEGTKVFQPNEFDFLSDHELLHCTIEGKAPSPNVKLISTGNNNDVDLSTTQCTKCHQLLRLKKGDVIDRNALFSHFYGAFAEALDDMELWINHPTIYRQSACDITSANRNISCLMVVIYDEIYTWVEATIDIVPSLHFATAPSWCNIPYFLSNQGCHVVGKWASSQPMDKELFQLGFCLSDAEMFHTMPAPLRDAYKLAKIVKDDTFSPSKLPIEHKYYPEMKHHCIRAKEFVTSYILKTITFMIYLSVRNADRKWNFDTYEQHITDVIRWSNAIYKILTFAFQKRRLDSLYISGYNLIGDAKYFQYQDTAIEYAQYLEKILAKAVITDPLVDYSIEACLQFIGVHTDGMTSMLLDGPLSFPNFLISHCHPPPLNEPSDIYTPRSNSIRKKSRFQRMKQFFGSLPSKVLKSKKSLTVESTNGIEMEPAFQIEQHVLLDEFEADTSQVATFYFQCSKSDPVTPLLQDKNCVCANDHAEDFSTYHRGENGNIQSKGLLPCVQDTELNVDQVDTQWKEELEVLNKKQDEDKWVKKSIPDFDPGTSVLLPDEKQNVTATNAADFECTPLTCWCKFP